MKRKPRTRSIAGIAIALALMSAPVHAGGWTMDEGTWRLSLTTTFTTFDRVELFDGSTGRVGDVDYAGIALGVETGLTDALMLSVRVPWEQSQRDGASLTAPSFDRRKGERGFGDGTARLTYRLLDEFDGRPCTVGVFTGTKIPLSDYDTNKLHSFGDGQIDFELGAGVGRFFELGGFSPFVGVEGGYRWRLEDPANELFFFAQVGAYVHERVALRAFVDYVDSLGGYGLESPAFGAKATAKGLPPFPRVEEDFTKVGFDIGIRANPTTDVSLFFAWTVDAESTSRDQIFGVSIGFDVE